MKTDRVTLTAEERGQLEQLLRRGKADVRKLKHAQIVLKADEPETGSAWSDETVAAAVGVGVARPWCGASGNALSRRAWRRPSALIVLANRSTKGSSMATRRPI